MHSLVCSGKVVNVKVTHLFMLSMHFESKGSHWVQQVYSHGSV